MNNIVLSEDTLLIYAAKHYHTPKFIDAEEFEEDLKRFKYIKRLLNRYIESGVLAERLILNHLIVVANVFGIEASLKILELKLDPKHWPCIKPFLIFLRHIRNDQYTNISMDKTIIDALRIIKWDC